MKIFVEGMTCASCETRVSKQLKKIPEVTAVKVSARHGTATLTTTNDPDLETIEKAVKKAGYKLGKTHFFSHDKHIWTTFIFSSIIVILILFLLTKLGFSNLTENFGEPGSGG
jgi:copper chaperone CopZ